MFTTDVGGISSFIQQGGNGYMLPLSATGEDFAHHIQQVLNNKDLYRNLRQQSRTQYEKALNWDVWVYGLRQELEKRNLLPV